MESNNNIIDSIIYNENPDVLKQSDQVINDSNSSKKIIDDLIDDIADVKDLINCSILLKTQIYDYYIDYANFKDKMREYLNIKRGLKQKILFANEYIKHLDYYSNSKKQLNKIKEFMIFLNKDYSKYSQFMNELCTLNTDVINNFENENYNPFEYFSDLHLKSQIKCNNNLDKIDINEINAIKLKDEFDEFLFKMNCELSINDSYDFRKCKEIDDQNQYFNDNEIINKSVDDKTNFDLFTSSNINYSDIYNYFNDFEDSDDELSYSNEYKYNYHIINKESEINQSNNDINNNKNSSNSIMDKFVELMIKKPDGMCVRISNDEKYISTCFSNGCIVNYSLKEKKYLNKIKASKNVLTSIRFRSISDEKTIITSACVDGFVKSYHVESGKFLSKINLINPVLSMDRDINSNKIVVGQEGSIKLIDENINSIVTAFEENDEQYGMNRVVSVNCKNNIVVSGCNSGSINLYDLRESKNY